MRKKISAKIVKKVKTIKLLILDVDGVMSDGRIIYDDDGNELKVFDVKDGHGIKMLMRGGVKVAIITARESRVVTHRARNLGIEMVYQHALDKIKAFEDVVRKEQLLPHEVAYIGDDLVDIPLLRRVGFAAAVNDAAPEVKKHVQYVTEREGGRGAVREICEMILKIQGKWNRVTEKYFV